jgi:tetratricopeptide (TPR) repeat protein
MQRIRSLYQSFSDRFLSTSGQVTRIIIFAIIALLLVLGTFAGYYWYDRFYTSQKPVEQLSLEKAQQAVQANPTDLNARLVLAETYLLYGRYEDALTHATQVFAKDPTLQGAWLTMGVANYFLDKPADAITPLTNYVEAFKDEEMPGLDKRLQEASYYLGLSYLALGQPDKAILPLEQTVGWSQLDADAMYTLGLAYSGVGRYGEAIAMFHSAINFVPNFTEVYQAMADAYKADNFPGLADYALGMVAYSQKDYPTAIQLLLKSSKSYPDFAPIFAGLGLTYEAMGDLQNAKISYDKAVSIDPENFTAANGAERVGILLNK